jgi:hypothetical protein
LKGKLIPKNQYLGEIMMKNLIRAKIVLFLANFELLFNHFQEIMHDLETCGRSVYSSLDQVDVVSEECCKPLLPEEVSKLRRDGEDLRRRYSAANSQGDHLLSKFRNGLGDAAKYRAEMDGFVGWLEDAKGFLEERERAISEVNKSRVQVEATKDFVEDVLAHQADLRFITMTAQKVFDEFKVNTNLYFARKKNMCFLCYNLIHVALKMECFLKITKC